MPQANRVPVFEKIVFKPFFLSRHRAAPMARERELFLAWLHRGGNGLGNLRITACYLLQIVRFLRLRAPRDVAQDEVLRAAKSWATYRGPNRRHPPGHYSEVLFARIARRWLRFHGRLLPRPPSPQPFSNLLDEFAGFMRSERGLAPITIEGCCIQVATFLAWFSKRHRKFSEVSIHDLDRYFATRPQNWTLVTRAGVYARLRAFFRYAENRGLCRPGIPAGLKSPAIQRNSSVPGGPKWSEILQMLQSTNGTSRPSKRAKALLSLLAFYGLRSSEAVGLRLTDFDWQNDTFSVKRAKGGRVQQFPLQKDVGEAIRRYIDEGRPQCSSPNLFVALHQPYRPLSKTSAFKIVSNRMTYLGIRSRHRGPHAIRHACATRLLQSGASLREIADFLGHRDCQSVGIYAKFDVQSMREIANLDLPRRL
jgi:integrase/recombinase XerD